MADSTTDVSHLEQMAILLRYLEINPEFEKYVVFKENCIGFYNIYKGDAESICNFMVKIPLKDIGLNKSFMIGQGFDKANVMSGQRDGLHAKMNKYLGDNTYAPYTICSTQLTNYIFYLFTLLLKIIRVYR